MLLKFLACAVADMNYDAMCDRELIHYLDWYNMDPLIRRLLNLVNHDGLMGDLEAVGMNPKTHMFETDQQDLTVAQYITSLHDQVRSLESELDSSNYELGEAIRERDELQTRSVMDFVNEVWQEKREAELRIRTAQQTVSEVQKENARLKEQIDMWGKLNQVKQGV